MTGLGAPSGPVWPGDTNCANHSPGHLAWLLACLDRAVALLDESGFDVDARIVEAHRAELVAGREWPGSTVTCPPAFSELEAVGS